MTCLTNTAIFLFILQLLLIMWHCVQCTHCISLQCAEFIFHADHVEEFNLHVNITDSTVYISTSLACQESRLSASSTDGAQCVFLMLQCVCWEKTDWTTNRVHHTDAPLTLNVSAELMFVFSRKWWIQSQSTMNWLYQHISKINFLQISHFTAASNSTDESDCHSLCV